MLRLTWLVKDNCNQHPASCQMLSGTAQAMQSYQSGHGVCARSNSIVLFQNKWLQRHPTTARRGCSMDSTCMGVQLSPQESQDQQTYPPLRISVNSLFMSSTFHITTPGDKRATRRLIGVVMGTAIYTTSQPVSNCLIAWFGLWYIKCGLYIKCAQVSQQ